MLFSFDTITNLWLFFNNRQQFYIKITHSTASQSGGILKGRISISLSSFFINWIFLLCPLFCFLYISFIIFFFQNTQIYARIPHRYTYLRKDVMMKKQKRMKQITAILLIVILLAIIGSTIYFAVSGSQLFWMSLFLMFFFPIFLWAMSFLYKWSKNKNEH